MTTSASSDLSAEAKEFVPLVQIPPPVPTTIPLYLGENTIASIYSTEQQQQSLIYPLIKIPEIEFHIQSSQQSSANVNTSQIVLLPAPGCYPGTFYPVDYPEQSLRNYFSHQQPKSRLQRGNNHSSYQNSSLSPSFNNQRNSYSTNSKRISRGIHSRPIQQHNEQKKEVFDKSDDDIQFKFRAEDFPTLPINNQQSNKLPIQSFTSTDTQLVYITELSK
jgi:hypothetical protein